MDAFTLKQRTLFLPWRLALTLVCSAIIGFISASLTADPRFWLAGPGGDFVGRSVIPAQELLSGQDPYAHNFTRLTVPYPFPAMLLGIPFAWLDNRLAGAAFIGLSTALLAFAFTRDGKYWRLLAFLSYPYLECIKDVQYAPLLMSIVFYSDLLPLILVKPQLAIPASLWQKPTLRGIILTVSFLIISLVIYPLWPLRWLSQVGSFGGYIPVLLSGGPVLLLSVLRWRKPQGRFLLALSILPKRAFYDTFMLWLIPEHWAEMLLLTVVSWLALGMGMPDKWNWLMLIYVTALVFVLRPSKYLIKKRVKKEINIPIDL